MSYWLLGKRAYAEGEKGAQRVAEEEFFGVEEGDTNVPPPYGLGAACMASWVGWVLVLCSMQLLLLPLLPLLLFLLPLLLFILLATATAAAAAALLLAAARIIAVEKLSTSKKNV